MKFIEPSKAPPTLNILLYGPGGTGKTVNACSSPGPILAANAEGEGALRFARGLHGNDKIREIDVTGANVLDEIYVYLKEGKGGEKTLILDSLGEIYQRLIDELAGTGRASLQNYGDINTKIERFIRAVRDLPINVVLIAHEQIDDEGGVVTRRPATGGKKLPEKIVAAVDVVAYCGVVPATDDAPTHWVGQLIEAGGRRAKDRTGALGDFRDLDLTEWIETGTAAMTARTPSVATADEGVESAERRQAA